MKLSKRLGVTALTLTVSMMFMFSVFAAPMVAGAHDRDHDRDHRGSHNAYLKLIRTNAGKLTPSFSKTHYCYKLTVSSHRHSVRVHAFAAEKHARVYYSFDKRCWKRGDLALVKLCDPRRDNNNDNNGPSFVPTTQNGPNNPGDNHNNDRCRRVYFKVVAQNHHTMRIYSVEINQERDHHEDHH